MENGDHGDFDHIDVLSGAGSDGLTSLPRKNRRIIVQRTGASHFDPTELDTAEEIAKACVRTGKFEALLEHIEEQREEAAREAVGDCIVRTVHALRDELDADPSPHLALRCMGLVTGSLVAEGMTQTSVAMIFDVTRAAVSKRVIRYKEVFNLVSRGMKSEAAREKYRDPTNKHWNQKRNIENYGKNTA